GWRPLLLARGGTEPYGREVLSAARAAGLKIVDRKNERGDCHGFVEAVGAKTDADVINLQTPVDPDSRRVLFRSAAAVLANSSHEPFGLVGLEAMAVGGIACTGCSGEDYVVPGRNALVLQTDDPYEFVGLYGHLQNDPTQVSAMRRAGRATARAFSWDRVVRYNLLPRLDLMRACSQN
ncbi:MAG: glycosyl transferase family 1, partial [Deltaproteobacteria bacterium]